MIAEVFRRLSKMLLLSFETEYKIIFVLLYIELERSTIDDIDN